MLYGRRSNSVGNLYSAGQDFYDHYHHPELKTYRIAQIFEKVNSLDERKRCLLCGKIVCNVRNHYYVHFPGKYACSLCTAVYTRSDTLLMHCRSKHPELNV
ncbi:hypothetical protein pipiens_001847 [Culex pipiens pipiens]|uniref:C2H2-type domain-containing protein n=1 Tax=Culex pipiens pipiens TaxID=38569 RepID=A0ABD1DSG0_CULPP